MKLSIFLTVLGLATSALGNEFPIQCHGGLGVDSAITMHLREVNDEEDHRNQGFDRHGFDGAFVITHNRLRGQEGEISFRHVYPSKKNRYWTADQSIILSRVVSGLPGETGQKIYSIHSKNKDFPSVKKLVCDFPVVKAQAVDRSTKIKLQCVSDRFTLLFYADAVNPQDYIEITRGNPINGDTLFLVTENNRTNFVAEAGSSNVIRLYLQPTMHMGVHNGTLRWNDGSEREKTDYLVCNDF